MADTPMTNTNQAELLEHNDQQVRRKASRVTYRPPMDLYELADRYEIRLDLPGTSADQIDVTIDRDVLSIRASVPNRYAQRIEPILAEYGVGDYEHQVRLGEDVDSAGLTASYTDGVLTLGVPKRAERQPRKIAVAGA